MKNSERFRFIVKPCRTGKNSQRSKLCSRKPTRFSPLRQNSQRTGLPDAVNCSALALTDDLLSESKQSAATALGRKGGSVIVKRGSDYFHKLAARRKTHGGGRPRKEDQ
jgi:hypothetical protein